MPDFYQGTEFWDFSLVDPDNRRPVDYAARRAALEEDPGPDFLLPSWRDGRIKQWTIRKILHQRQHSPDLFARGGYVPLSVHGPMRDRIVAFARNQAPTRR